MHSTTHAIARRGVKAALERAAPAGERGCLRAHPPAPRDGWGALVAADGDAFAPALVAEALELPEAAEPDSPLGLYLREIGRSRLLTAEEEVQLARERDAGRTASRRLARGVRDPAQRRALEAIVARGEAARQRLIEANLRLSVAVAHRYADRGMALLDLIQEANLGLQRAVEKYDWRKGFRFSTYAYWWIRQAVTRAIADQGRTIRLPVHVAERLSRLRAVGRELEAELGRPPTPPELAKRLGLRPERVLELLQASKAPVSLDTPVGEEGEQMLADFVPDRRGAGPAEVAEGRALSEALNQALEQYLTRREAYVLRLRFGLETGRAMSLVEIGQRLGITRERARQIEATARSKLRSERGFRARMREFLE